jgi:anti-sigma factor ChrR (cupin superfamily)
MSGRGHRDMFADEMQWAEGTSPGVLYTRFMMDEDDPSSPLAILTKFEAGETVEPHTHASNYFEYVIEGEQTVGKTVFRKGDVRIVKGGTGYGPITIGSEGCTVLILFQNANGAMMEPKGLAAVEAQADG